MIPPWLAWSAIRKLPWKLIGAGALLAVLVGSFLWYRHSLIAQGDATGAARVQTKWDAANKQARAVADAATRKNELKDAADAARNLEVENAYRAKLAAATADRSRLTGLLQRAIQAASGSGASPRPDQPGATPASPQGSPEPAPAETGLAADLAAVLIEARQNAEQLDALIAEIRPQQ